MRLRLGERTDETTSEQYRNDTDVYRVGYRVVGRTLPTAAEADTLTVMATSQLTFEILDSEELARRLGVTQSWVENSSQRWYTSDPIPTLKLGRTVRYRWGSPEMEAWLERRAGKREAGSKLKGRK